MLLYAQWAEPTQGQYESPAPNLEQDLDLPKIDRIDKPCQLQATVAFPPKTEGLTTLQAASKKKFEDDMP